MFITLIKIFPLIVVTSYLSISLHQRYRLIEKLFAITLLAFLTINLNAYYFSDFINYVEWIKNSETIVHRDYLFTQVLKILNLFPNAETSLRMFLFTFYSILIITFCRHNTILFVVNPIILDCIFNSQRAGIAISLITIFFMKKPLLNILIFPVVFFFHKYFSVYIFLIQSTKLFKLKFKLFFIIFISSVIAYFFSNNYYSELDNINRFAYMFINSGKGWSEFYDTGGGSLWGKVSRFVVVSIPAILTILSFQSVNTKIATAILVTTTLILILGPSFSIFYRLSLLSYLLLTQIKIKNPNAQLIKLICVLIGVFNLMTDMEYTF